MCYTIGIENKKRGKNYEKLTTKYQKSKTAQNELVQDFPNSQNERKAIERIASYQIKGLTF